MKTTKFFAVFIAAILFTACGGDDDDFSRDFGQIKVPDTRQLEQTVAGDDTQTAQGVTFTTQAAWSSTITEKIRAAVPTWISISPDHGDAGTYTIKITLEKNDSGSERSATISITCGGTTITITITQGADKGPDDGDGGDEPLERRYYYPRRIIEYDEQGEVEDRCEFEFEPQDGKMPGRILSVKFYSGTEKTPYESHTFTYTANTDMRYVETYTDKGTYSYTTNAQGNFDYLENIIRSAHSSDSRSATINYNYNSNRIEEITSIYKDGGPVTDAYEWTDGNCTRIRWNIDSESEIDQYQEYTFADRQEIFQEQETYRRLLDGRQIDLSLLFIEEPDMLRVFGFYGRQNFYLPSKVTTVYNKDIDTQEFSYSYNDPDKMPNDAESEGMRITVKSSYNGKLEDTRTFSVIFYSN